MNALILQIFRIFIAILRDLGAGMVEIASALGRAIASLFRKLTSSPRPKPTGARKYAMNLPSLRVLVFAIGSTILWISVVVLAMNIRFAAMVLPASSSDLYSANRPASLTILDRNGDIIGIRGSIYSDPLDFQDIPPILIEAIIATEDRRFYRHIGFDTRGVGRAVFANLRAGEFVEGGSTITQQLAKNLFLTPEKTLIRKLEEIQLAVWLEARFTKEEILSLYLNRIYMGAGTFGIEAAAQAYFSKSARQLTDQEAIMIAGIPQAPSTYAPTSNWDAAIQRSYIVINNLVETGTLTRTQADELLANPPVLKARPKPISYGYFLDHVVNELTARLGETGEDLVVTTTLDSRLQAFAEEAVSKVMGEPNSSTRAEQAALIAYDKDGGIVAMIGGRNYANSQFNRATQAKRQPGSAFKPFVFLAALEAGLTPETIVVDQSVKVGKWAPRNYSKHFSGPMRLSTAVAKSSNTIAVQVAEFIGRERIIDAARRAGIEAPLEPVASLALGSMEISLDELTAAFMPFAHKGFETPAHVISKVRTRNGREIGSFSHSIENFQIIETGHTHETTRMLMQVVQDGTGRRAALPGWDVAGKTGTTNEWRDAWFVGFTSEITAGVWVGNDTSSPMDEVSGSSLPLQIWHEFMSAAHKGKTPTRLLDDRRMIMEDVSRLGSYYATLRSDLIDIMYGPPKADIASWRSMVPNAANSQNGVIRLPPSGTIKVVGQAAPGVTNSHIISPAN